MLNKKKELERIVERQLFYAKLMHYRKINQKYYTCALFDLPTMGKPTHPCQQEHQVFQPLWHANCHQCISIPYMQYSCHYFAFPCNEYHQVVLLSPNCKHKPIRVYQKQHHHKQQPQLPHHDSSSLPALSFQPSFLLQPTQKIIQPINRLGFQHTQGTLRHHRYNDWAPRDDT